MFLCVASGTVAVWSSTENVIIGWRKTEAIGVGGIEKGEFVCVHYLLHCLRCVTDHFQYNNHPWGRSTAHLPSTLFEASILI